MRRGIVILFALTLGWALTTGISTAAADTTVSLTFDDGNADQMPAKDILADHEMKATFYIITGKVGEPGRFTWGEIASLFADGNEIGGHTRNHVHLAGLTAQQQHDEICGGRDDLLARGYPQVSFAYPFGDQDATSEQVVEQCGYLSGRDVTNTNEFLANPETIPPADAWAIRTPGSIDKNDTLPEIEDWITDAEALGETSDVWVPLVIHHICDPPNPACDDPSQVNGQYITRSDFDALLDWLAGRKSMGTRVRTVGQVMEKTPQPIQISPTFTFASAKSRRNGTAKLVFVVGGSGTLDAVDARASAVVAKKKKKHRARIRPASKFVAQAGDATLVIKASKAGKRTLKRKGKLKVPVRVTFTPLAGSPSAQTIKVKLRLKRHRRA